MRQAIKLDRVDLSSLRAGQPLMLSVNGQELEILYDAGHADAIGRPRVCPFCTDGHEYGNVTHHIRAKHPGKGTQKHGGVKCPDCGGLYASATGMAVHRRARHKKKEKPA